MAYGYVCLKLPDSICRGPRLHSVFFGLLETGDAKSPIHCFAERQVILPFDVQPDEPAATQLWEFLSELLFVFSTTRVHFLCQPTKVHVPRNVVGLIY